MKKILLITLCSLCMIIAIVIFTKAYTALVIPQPEEHTSAVVKRIQAKQKKEQRNRKKCGCCTKRKLDASTYLSTQ